MSNYLIFKTFYSRGTAVTPYILREQVKDLQNHLGKLFFLYFNPVGASQELAHKIMDAYANKDYTFSYSLESETNPINLIDDITISSTMEGLPDGKLLVDFEGAHAEFKDKLLFVNDETFQEGEKLVLFFEADMTEVEGLPKRLVPGTIVTYNGDRKIFPGRRISPKEVDLKAVTTKFSWASVNGLPVFKGLRIDEELLSTVDPFKTFEMKFKAPIEHEEKEWRIFKY